MALAQRSAVARVSAAPRVAPRPVVSARRVAARVSVIDVNDNTFANDVLKSPVPVLVDFWAPCQ